MHRTLERLWHQRRLLLVALLVVGLGAGAFAAGLRVDNGLEVWFPSDDPALVSYHRFLDDFGNDEVIVTALHRAGAGLDAARLERLERVGAAIAAVDGVARVRSLATHAAADAVIDVAPAANASDDGLLAKAERALASGGLARRFVGEGGDTDTLVLYTWLDAAEGIDEARPRILDDVRAATGRALAGSGEDVSHAGMGILYDAINRATLGEGSIFIGLSYLVIVLALLWLTRSVRWTALAVVVVTLTDAAVLGVMTLCGRPITMFTMALPALLLVLGVAHVVHVHSHLVEDAGGAPRTRAALLWSLAGVLVPCALNALTTAAGFLSLMSASVAITRDFGVFAALGVALSFVFAIGLTLVFLLRLPVPPRRGPSERLRAVVERVMLASVRHRWRVLAGALVVVAGSVLGAARIVPDTFALGFLPADHPLHEHSAEVEERFGPYLPLELVLTTKAPGAWREPTFLAALARTQDALEADPRFGQTLSVADVLAEAERTLANAGHSKRYVPEDPSGPAQLLELLSSTPNAKDVSALVAADDRSLRLTVTVPMSTASGFRVSAERALEIARPLLAGHAVVEPSGYLPLNWKMAAGLVRDQVTSFALAFAVVFLILALALRSWRLTLAAVPANLVPVVLTLGVMGFAGIRLDIATVTIAASVLGIIVDDSIHLLFAIRRARTSGARIDEAVRRAAGTTGVAIATTSVVFAAGFFVIATSSVSSVGLVGLLTGVAVVAALVCDLVLLPAVLAVLYGAGGARVQAVSVAAEGARVPPVSSTRKHAS